MLRMCFASLLFFTFGIYLFYPNVSFADTTFTSSSAIEKLALANNNVYTLDIASSPYFFTSGIFVSKNVTINVDPGVKIFLGQNRNIQFFNGTFNAIGTVENPITITSDGSYYGQLFFHSVNGDVTANLINVNLINGDWCSIVGKSKTVYKNVTINMCRTVPVSISLISGTDVTMDNVSYIRWNRNPVINTTFYMPIPSGFDNLHPVNVVIKNSTFVMDGSPIFRMVDQTKNTFDPTLVNIKINNNNFTGKVKNASPFQHVDTDSKKVIIDATNNYWGTSQGPYVNGSKDKTDGPVLPSNINFIPFLTESIITLPEIPPKIIKECCSSIMFFPGVEGSRLYKKDNLNPDGEDQLWEANYSSDIVELYGNSDGISQDGIYTRDVIERTNIFGENNTSYDIYKKIIDNLKSLKENKTIIDYLPVPYDWRENVDDIIKDGINLENDQKMDIVKELEILAENSDTGKVTIVAHSNGGLLSKALIHELEVQGKQDLVDKVVMVASPQIGTPDAIYALLHGLNFGFPSQIIAPQKYNRKLAENIEMTYSLLPSKKYFEMNTHPVFFDESISGSTNLYEKYGENIDSFSELKDFILGKLDSRINPDFDETSLPAVGNETLYNKAYDLHEILDNYNLPENIKLYKLSGTGIATNKAILYKDRKLLGKQIFTPYLIKSIYGDGTVLNKSSSVGVGENYYFDLYNYNLDNKTIFDHANIFEADPIINFINNIVGNKNEDVNYITTNSPDFDNLKSISIEMHSPVYMQIYDSDGNHTGTINGKDDDGNDVVSIEENIPNSKYEILGESVIITLSGDREYILKLDGYDEGEFTLNINNYVGDELTNSQNFENLPASADLLSEIKINTNGEITEMNLDTNGDGKMDLNIKSDGTIVDLNEVVEPEIIIPEPEPEPEPEPDPVRADDNDSLPASNGTGPVIIPEPVQQTGGFVFLPQFLNNPNPISVTTIPEPVVQEQITVQILEPEITQIVIKKPIAIAQVKKTIAKTNNKNVIIKKDKSVIVNKTSLKNSQTASAGDSLKWKFNLIDFIRKIFKRK
ncbi:hypothetical protein A2903_02460 [Candidatus Nomurabacteria bacterium RIFCSPLOWO2_01_FULL_33_17]|uniref:Uncharacterized protein n=1 Tax=Candidatus Nomurabacteria bacterium RIFCSPLOWO2_01_FULL_33_17 TaxID=1801764 RepID=A0A1F6WP55_9BACT|nr:MAG: hypothetical protein A2903_02460 [Candidatus Nomurabacteria bacterium RIFCSPLOWO2_01_FULL_33_17]